MGTRSVPLFVFVLVLALPGALRAQATWIVDALGGGQFTTIAAAFDAAAPGDTLLVRPGTYAGFARSPAKGVCIVASGPGVVVDSPVSFANVPGGQTLHLAGFRIDARINPWGTPGLAGTRALHVSGCDGLVLCGVELFSAPGTIVASYGREALQLVNCNGVLSGVLAVGGDGAPATAIGFSGGEAMEVQGCRLALSRCTLRNGAPGTGILGNGTSLPCLIVTAQSLLAVDECRLQPTTGEALSVADSRVLLADHVAGVAGVVNLVPSATGASLEVDGAVAVAAGSAAITPRAQPGLVGPDTAECGDTLTWTVHGAPGRAGVVVASLGLQSAALPWLVDTWLFTAAHPTSTIGGGVVVGAGGTATASLVVPDDPSLVGATVFVQIVGWLGQPTWKASGVAVTRIR